MHLVPLHATLKTASTFSAPEDTVRIIQIIMTDPDLVQALQIRIFNTVLSPDRIWHSYESVDPEPASISF